MKRRIISLILIFGLFLGVCPYGYAEKINNEPSFADTIEYGFLNTLNILPDTLEEGGKITRGEFMYMVSRLYFSGVTYSYDNLTDVFSDVKKDHPYINEIITLKNAKIVVGDLNNRLRCDEEITLSESLAIILRCAGYEQYAVSNGGYPTGYIHVANNEGVLKGVDTKKEPLDTFNALKIIYNSLFMKVISLDKIENGEINLIKGSEMILKSHLGITLYDSVITNNGMTSLDGSNLREGRIEFSEILTGKKIVAKNTFSDVFSYLGVRMSIFVKYNEETSEEEVVYLKVSDKVTSKVLTDNEIISINSDYIEYQPDKNLSKYYKLYYEKDKPYVIINGINTPSYLLSDLSPKNGFATFIDNDADDKIDVINVVDFSHAILCERVSEDVLYCNVNPINTLDLSEDNDKIYYKIIKNNTVIMPEDINTYDTVSVAVSKKETDGKKLYILYVSDDYITGKVEAYSDDYILINETEYKMTDAFKTANPQFNSASCVGISGTFRLNVSGKIEFLDKGVSTDIPYSYLINIGKEEPFGDVLLKYYSVKGEMVTHTLSSNVKIDGCSLDGKLINGNSASSFDEVKELLCVRPDGSIDIPQSETYSFYNKKFTHINPRPAILKLNSKNEIVSIDTDAPTYTGGVLNEDFSQALVPFKRHPKDIAFYGTTHQGEFLIGADTICIKVPDVDRYGLLDGKYSITYMNTFETDVDDINNYGIYNATSYLKSGVDYDMQAYNVDNDTGYADVVIVRGEPLKRSVTTSSSFAVFVKLVSCYDSIREKNAYKLYYYQAGEVRSTLVDTDYLHIWYKNLLFGGQHPKTILNPGTMSELAFYENVEPLKEGDIIAVETTGSYLSMIARDLNISKVYDKIPSTSRSRSAESSYAYNSYNVNATSIPFDEYNQKLEGYETSANFEIGVALGINGNVLKTRLMYDNTTKVSTIRDYIETDGNIDYFDRFSTISSTVPVTLITETLCNVSSDSCKFIVEEGSLSDIKPALSDSKDDINKASKLFIYNARGTVREIVILNLLESHIGH